MADERERCPRCGCEVETKTVSGLHFHCGTFAGDDGRGHVMTSESRECLRRQLAQAQARIEELEHEVRQLRGILATQARKEASP